MSHDPQEWGNPPSSQRKPLPALVNPVTGEPILPKSAREGEGQSGTHARPGMSAPSSQSSTRNPTPSQSGTFARPGMGSTPPPMPDPPLAAARGRYEAESSTFHPTYAREGDNIGGVRLDSFLMAVGTAVLLAIAWPFAVLALGGCLITVIPLSAGFGWLIGFVSSRGRGDGEAMGAICAALAVLTLSYPVIAASVAEVQVDEAASIIYLMTCPVAGAIAAYLRGN